MRFDISKNFKEYVGHHTLLYGETNTKKTLYTAKFVQFLVESNFDPLQITILDFGPKMNTISGNNQMVGVMSDMIVQESQSSNPRTHPTRLVPTMNN